MKLVVNGQIKDHSTRPVLNVYRRQQCGKATVLAGLVSSSSTLSAVYAALLFFKSSVFTGGSGTDGSHSLPPCAPHLASAMCIRQPLYVSGEGLIRAQLRRLPCHDVH